MRKIKCWMGTGFAGATHEDELEFDDDATDEEIAKEVWEYFTNFLDVGWEEVKTESKEGNNEQERID
ncbi:MAG: hypothetical protein ACLTPR_07590 [Enterococcus canintestini]|uniref:DUF7167 family protein n=1 Tax=Enterococcus canintestini TaxID=317010 RepID=UPI003992EA80